MESHRADVGECEGSSCEVSGAQLSCWTQSLQTVELHSNVKNTEGLNALHIGHQEALRSVHRQADVMRRLTTMKMLLMLGSLGLLSKPWPQNERLWCDWSVLGLVLPWMWCSGSLHPQRHWEQETARARVTRPEQNSKNTSYNYNLTANTWVKVIVHPKKKMVSTFTHPQVGPNLYEFFKEEILKNVGHWSPLTPRVCLKKFYGSQWVPETVWLPTFFKISSSTE